MVHLQGYLYSKEDLGGLSLPGSAIGVNVTNQGTLEIVRHAGVLYIILSRSIDKLASAGHHITSEPIRTYDKTRCFSNVDENQMSVGWRSIVDPLHM